MKNKRLNDWLKRQNMTRSELARRLGVSSPNVHYWLTDEQPIAVPRAIQLEKLSDGELCAEELSPLLADFLDLVKARGGSREPPPPRKRRLPESPLLP